MNYGDEGLYWRWHGIDSKRVTPNMAAHKDRTSTKETPAQQQLALPVVVTELRDEPRSDE